MLYKETIERPALELLIQLQQKEYLNNFCLAGGTALALRLGHRKSVDIDLFSDFSFDAGNLLEKLTADFDFKLFFSAVNTIKGSINTIQVDILGHRYPLIGNPLSEEGITTLSLEDIIAMKLNAIATSGQRVKDFVDIYFLLDKYSIGEMISFYKKKYSQYNEVIVLKSITWFDDVTESDWPVILKQPGLKWEDVKSRIREATELYLKQL
jgi:predicted nucleotidyltransferase component of viral defense system